MSYLCTDITAAFNWPCLLPLFILEAVPCLESNSQVLYHINQNLIVLNGKFCLNIGLWSYLKSCWLFTHCLVKVPQILWGSGWDRIQIHERHLNLHRINNFSYLMSNSFQKQTQEIQTVYPQWTMVGMKYNLSMFGVFTKTNHILHKFIHYRNKMLWCSIIITPR